MKKIRKWLRENTKAFLVIDAMLIGAIALCVFGPAKPEPVDGLSVADSTYSTAHISWNEAEHADSYRVYRSENGRDYEFVIATTKTEYTDKNLRTGQKYYYKVTSGNVLKSSDIKTAEKTDIVPELEKPELDVDTADGEIRLSISEVDGAAGYEIIRNGEVIDQVKDTTYVDEDASGDEEYDYKVKAYRYEDGTVYSEKSNKVEAVLHTVGDVKVDVLGEDLLLSWDKNEHYIKYKVFSGDEEIFKTTGDSCEIKDFEYSRLYDIKVIGVSEDETVQSPESEKRFEVVEEAMTNEEAIDAAVDWGIKIAEDDSFTYGTGKRAHRYGCYFCETNVGPRLNKKGKSLVNGHSYEKTYCCNPFVHACYAHGAGDPAMLKACRSGSGIAMTVKSFTRYGCWEYEGKVSRGDLKKGDVLVRSNHVMMYIGDGKIVHAGGGGWSADSIRVCNLGNRKYSFVMRYTGSGDGTKSVVRDVDENGNLLDEDGNVIEESDAGGSDEGSGSESSEG